METFIIDLDQKKSFISRISLRQGDGGLQKVLIQIIKNGAEYNASGYSVIFEANLADGRLVQGNALASDEVKGLFEYTFRRADAAAVGTMRNAYFKVLDASGNALSTRDVNIIVEKSAVLPTFQHDKLLTDVENLVNEVDEKTQELLNSTSSKLSENNQAIANQATQIADLQEALSDVSLHQAWMTGEDGEGFSLIFNENYALNSKIGEEQLADGNWKSKYSFIDENFPNENGDFEISCELVAPLEISNETANIEVWLQIGGTDVSSKNVFRANVPIKSGEVKRITNIFKGDFSTLVKGSAYFALKLSGLSEAKFRLNNLFLKKYKGFENVWTPAPADDPINCYPKYVGFGIKTSDNYQDYRWILNPEWAMANAIHGTQVTTLKEQLNKLQDLQEG